MAASRLYNQLQRSPPNTRWGLYVYRATYEDQSLWERYMEYVHNAVLSHLQPFDDKERESDALRYQKLRDSFRLVIREDKAWDNLTLLQMREIFDRSSLLNVNEPDPTSWLTCGMDRWYFVYVNKETLMDFQAIDDSRQAPTPNYLKEEVTFIIVHTQPGWREPDDDDVGKEWQYMCGYWFSQFYELTYRDSDGWFTLFIRPPHKWNGY
ncbi:hypothetical protein F5B22DRAFT_652611 [Xylaria bambusicola]|uniref:uncharacterized protein n=1 Tax=Xylaria bambusicola TaxID=326684 RepID=UPI002008B3CC|nr:uncharacterized protein F5B22DRAFT_652611 [Xylaria bambusicola]KAI0502919.1 hypothetical protein F5B22DRAFT_652611 [Xylaria bambusicola]